MNGTVNTLAYRRVRMKGPRLYVLEYDGGETYIECENNLTVFEFE
jgi:hypothetical protein